jgi:nucleotide-binding universal stress UspA family protein
MRKILVATDGSENALRAVDFAVQQAALAPVAELHILTVPPPSTSFVGLDLYVPAEKIQELRDAHAREALQSAERRLSGTGCRFTLEQLDGEPAVTIARRAEELGCESIVMGTHGVGRLGMIVMGSVAQRVVHHAAVPVTLVK